MEQRGRRSRVTLVLGAVLLLSLLVGCGGGGLLGLIFNLVSVGKLVASVTDLFDRFGGSADDYMVYYDGYALNKRPNIDGSLRLEGLPVGTHLISVVETNSRTGFHQSVEIVAGQADLPLGDYNPVQGATIKGTVQRQTGTGQVAVANQLVVGVFGGAELLRAGIGGTVTIPPPAGTVYVMGYTDNTGRYTLGPCEYGNWLVFSALPGYYADARFVAVAGGNDATAQNLLLQENLQEPSGRVTGAVATSANVALNEALVYAEFATPYRPQLSPARAAQLAGQAGFPLIAQPWVGMARLGTISGAAGAYTMLTKTGGQTIVGFKYDYRAKSADVNIGHNENLTIDFGLDRR